VILCHGYRTSRTHLRSVATLNYACGYNVMLFDFRGHGNSDSVTTSGGKAEVRDLEAAIEVARRQPETKVGQIILHGFSMGAAVALMMPLHPEVVAIIADSPYARSEDILRRLVAYRLEQESLAHLPAFRPHPHVYSVLAWGTLVFSMILFRIRFGYGFVAHPPENFKRWREREDRLKRRVFVASIGRLVKRWTHKGENVPPLEQCNVPILLIHARQDPLIPFSHAQTIAAAAKINHIPLETYFADCNVHCGVYGINPAQYYHILYDFLAQALGPALPEKHGKIQTEYLPILLSPGDIL
ncbi:MAG TPA: alpha/beta hydrolase, partial [Ktedonobacteraceae bacterium]